MTPPRATRANVSASQHDVIAAPPVVARMQTRANQAVTQTRQQARQPVAPTLQQTQQPVIPTLQQVQQPVVLMPQQIQQPRQDLDEEEEQVQQPIVPAPQAPIPPPAMLSQVARDALQFFILRNRNYINAINQPVEVNRPQRMPKPRLNLDVHYFLEAGDDSEMKLLCGLNCLQFKNLYTFAKEILNKGTKVDARVGPKDKLFLALCWCKHAASFKVLGAQFGLKTTYTHDVVIGTILRTHKALEDKFITWIPVVERMNAGLVVEDYKTMLGAVDATVQQIERPKSNQEDYYSGKHKMHCVKVQALVSPSGKLMHFSQAVPGAVHDFRLFKDQTELIAKILAEKTAVNLASHADPILLADSGYQGIKNIIPFAVTPAKKPRGGQLDTNAIDFNRTLSQNRIVVENFFARLKRKWRIVSYRFPLDIGKGLETYSAIWGFCAAVTNMDILSHPLRIGVNNVLPRDPPSDDPDYVDNRDMDQEYDE